jgi:hypothetical protein
MQINFSAQQKMLGLFECERLCGRRSRDVEELAHRAGWRGLPGAQVSVSVSTALNMLVLSTAIDHGMEFQSMATHLPGLRNEALLKLGEETRSWYFEGAHEAEQQFWPMLYGSREVVRPRIAPLLGSSPSVTTRELRVFSESDVERLSLSQFEQGYSARTPRFTIDAHSLAAQVEMVCGSPMFTANLATTM